MPTPTDESIVPDYCPECGNPLNPDIDQDASSDLCSSCMREVESVILSYSTKPRPIFHRNVDDTRSVATTEYYGIELEMECISVEREEAARTIRDSGNGFVYIKSDCSLECGIEVVSHPGTLDFWTDPTGDANSMLACLDSMGGVQAYDTETCGMHIHVGRASLSGYAQFRLMAFGARNDEYLFKVSRRKREKFDRYSGEDTSSIRQMVHKAKGGIEGSRYVSFNCTTKTIECRIFRGTIHSSSVLRNLLWFDVLIQFVKAPTSTRDDLHPEAFREWAKANLDKRKYSKVFKWELF